MELIRGIHNIKKRHKDLIVTIGNFDGLHRGHQQLLKTLRNKADHYRGHCCVVTFEPLPHEFFQINNKIPRLTSLREKFILLKKAKVDYMLVIAFNKHVSQWSENFFVKNILSEKLNIKHILVGDDFRFGCNRTGNYELLKNYAQQTKQFAASHINSHKFAGKRVSSTNIREAITKGNFIKAKQFLGRSFNIFAKVTKGQGIGKKALIPTANLLTKKRLLPVQGVYLIKAKLDTANASVIPKKHDYYGIANVGYKPTLFNNAHQNVEIHLFELKQDIYYCYLNVEFLSKIRDEQTFSSLTELKNQIDQDIIVAMDQLKKMNDFPSS